MHREGNHHGTEFKLIFSTAILVLILLNGHLGDSFNLSPNPNLAFQEPSRFSSKSFFPIKGRSSYFGLSINLKKNT